MKRFLTILTALAIAISMTACGKSAEQSSSTQPESKPSTEISAPEKENAPAANKAPSGIQDDGIGDDPMHGEGIGEVIALSEDEKASVLSHSAYTWLELPLDQKNDMVALMGRWLEDSSGYIVPDYDDLIVMLDRQMEQYFRNGVDEGLIQTTCDILGVALPADVPARPSGVWEDGIGDDPNHGEGIGEVIALSEDEQSYMMSQTTNSWLKLTQTEKDDLVVLVGRWLEATNGFIVPDYDDLIVMLDRQMEQYFRNGVDEGVLDTAKDIYGLA